MNLEIVDKTFNILCIEDDRTTQKVLSDYLTRRLPISITPQTTALGAQRYIQAEPYDSINLIICDWMLPVWDASYLIKDLYNLGKRVIFFTCLEEDDVKDRVKSVLGIFPLNFEYVQKAEIDYLENMAAKIRDCML